MPRLVRQFLVVSLVAFHAAVTLTGPCLHALPGWGHDPGLSASASTDHSLRPDRLFHGSTDDCPVCHFLSQGQLPIELTCVSSVQLDATFRPIELPIDPPRPTRPTSCPRAPPVSSAI